MSIMHNRITMFSLNIFTLAGFEPGGGRKLTFVELSLNKMMSSSGAPAFQ
jgi:hypothetical protein